MLWGEKYVETSKPEKKLMFTFDYFFAHYIFMEDKTPTEAFSIFPLNVEHSLLKIVIIDRHSSLWLMIL